MRRTKQYMSDADWSPPMLYLPFHVCQEMCSAGLMPRGNLGAFLDNNNRNLVGPVFVRVDNNTYKVSK